MVVSSIVAGRRLTKSGCRTCKLRKIKCDEAQPACVQCSKTGRRCDGYGIWGGGHPERCRPPQVTKGAAISLHGQTASLLPAGYTPSEIRTLEWFTERTLKKIPGPFALKFWRDLVVQACMTESAVMHAVLALGYTHRGGVEGQLGSDTSWDERLALKNYSKAIAQLQPHFASDNNTSLRITLITCLVFVSHDYLRGHYRTAEVHLYNGLRILRALAARKCIGSRTNTGPSLADDCIAQAFSRLCLHSALFKPAQNCPKFTTRPVDAPDPTEKFTTTDEAWLHLENILHDILKLTDDARSEGLHEDSTVPCPQQLLDRRSKIQNRLTQWSSLLDESKLTFRLSTELAMVCNVLRCHHAMAIVMTKTCLRNDESQYDAHTKDFEALLAASNAMCNCRIENPMTRPLWHRGMAMAHSMVDVGWIAPLFYAGTKCRVGRLRRQALRCIEYSTHREGIWDSRVAATIMREVVCREEGIDTKSLNLDDADEMERKCPIERRIAEFHVELPDDGSDTVGFFYKTALTGSDWESISLAV